MFDFKKIGLLLCVSGLMLTAVIWYFWPWMPQVFAGDDLGGLLAFKDGYFASSLNQALTAGYFEKYRPVFALAVFALCQLFDDHLVAYLIVNMLIQTVNAALFYLIAFRLSRSWLISGAIALAVAVSRFSLYQVVQTTGLVEGLALVFFLLMLYGIVRAAENEKFAYRWSWFAIIAAFLALNTHERYIVIIPWLIGAIFFLPNISGLSWVRKVILISTTSAAFLFNIAYKKIILHVPFFVGTGGYLIAFDGHRIELLTLEAIFSLFGFNRGSEYLVAVKISSLPWLAKAAAAGFALSLLFALIKGIYIALKEKQILHWPLLLIALIGFLLAPPLMSIHLEQRWLVEPFILIMFLLVWALTLISVRSRALGIGLALMASFSSITLDSIIAPYFYNLFFMESAHFGAMVKRDIIDKYPRQKIPLVFITPKPNCTWVLQKGGFFRIYGGVYRTVYCFDTLKEAINSNTLPANMPVYEVSGLNYAAQHLVEHKHS